MRGPRLGAEVAAVAQIKFGCFLCLSPDHKLLDWSEPHLHVLLWLSLQVRTMRPPRHWLPPSRLEICVMPARSLARSIGGALLDMRPNWYVPTFSNGNPGPHM